MEAGLNLLPVKDKEVVTPTGASIECRLIARRDIHGDSFSGGHLRRNRDACRRVTFLQCATHFLPCSPIFPCCCLLNSHEQVKQWSMVCGSAAKQSTLGTFSFNTTPQCPPRMYTLVLLSHCCRFTTRSCRVTSKSVWFFC